MKYRILLLVTMLVTSCAAPSDPTFMQNAAASINGGMIGGPAGAMMAPGLQNRNRPHPFFGTP